MFSWKASLARDLAEHGYTLARFAKPLAGGYTWQNWAHRALAGEGTHRVQGPGSRHLFGSPSLSGLNHEIDAAGIRDIALVLEAKDQQEPLHKGQVDEFDGKTIDYYAAIAATHQIWPLYRMVWSTGVISTPVRRYAALKDMILVSPDRVPLPSLLAASECWDAVEWFPEPLLSDFVTLAERACAPLRAQLSCKGLAFCLPRSFWKQGELEDLDYLHQFASDAWLNWLDKTDPLFYERAAMRALQLVSGFRERSNLLVPDQVY